MSAPDQHFVIAVDGGQSSTLALLANPDGMIISYGRGGPSNHYNEPGGHQRLESALRDSTTEALQSAGLSAEAVSHICLGMSGVHAQALVISQALFPGAQIQLLHDAVTALAGASIAQPGVIVIAGTGAVAYGRLDSGADALAGGWGYVIGDEGSGYWIGVEAIRAACKANDGRGEPTVLQQKLPEHLQLADLKALHRKLYAHELSRGEIASLSAVAASAAQAGDRAAIRVFEQAGEELGQAALAVIGRLGQLEAGQNIYHTGGVFRAGALILNSFSATITAQSPNSVVKAAAFSPSVGGLLLALKAAGVELTPAVLNMIRQTLPVYALLKRHESD